MVTHLIGNSVSTNIIISFYNDRLINHSLFIWGKKINLLEREEILGYLTASINVKLHLNFQNKGIIFKDHDEVTSHNLIEFQALFNNLITSNEAQKGKWTPDVSKFTFYRFMAVLMGEASNPLWTQVWNCGTSNHTFQISSASLFHFISFGSLLQSLSQPRPILFSSIP